MKISGEAQRRILDAKTRYPSRSSAILPALHILEEDQGYVTEEGMAEIAGLLDMPMSDVGGVASFYSMFMQRPSGTYRLDVCRTLSCALLGSEHLVDYLSEKLGIKVGETTPDGLFTLRTVECLGDCGKAPVMMAGDTYYEDLTPEKLDAILDDLRRKAEA
ncbi:MAG: NADH-quinone oxidoreductase subunit NuoE [Armatimonadetes bacterium]|nr:NADH-quinone oxidoreductase subunit NuoE [Armatimonadota bacterium]